jgi:hypothetical protein
VHAAGPERSGPQRAPLAVSDDSGLLGVHLFLARDERAAPRLAGPRTADLDFGAVQPQLYTLGRGVGEDVRQGAQLQAGAARHSEPAGGQQRPDLADRAGDRGAVHPVELCQCRVRELKAQRHQGHDDTVGDHELVIRACSRRTQTLMTPALTQPGLLSSHPGASQLSDEFAEAPRLEAGEDTLGQGRAAQVMRHNITQAARACLMTRQCRDRYRAPCR